MKSKIRAGIALGIVFAIFTILYFAIPYPHKNESTYILAYVFLVVAFLAQIYVVFLAFSNSSSIKSKLYGWPIFNVGITYLILQTISTAVVSIVNAYYYFPIWIVITISILLMGFTAIGLISTKVAKEIVEQQDDNTAAKTSFIDQLRANSKIFLESVSHEPLKKKATDLLELIKFSDPISNESVLAIEEEIDVNYEELVSTYKKGDYGLSEQKMDSLSSLIKQRNSICKSSK